jgi:3-hydroxybutyryl-CoA dehydrogenase
MMPAHFGMPKIEGKPSGWYHDVTAMNVSYVTDRDKLQALLPAPFSVADEALITVTYACSKNIDWLAGRGYNLVSVTAAVKFDGQKDHLEGTFALVVWENLADPILTGREMTGIPKVFADIPDHTVRDGVWHCGASHFGSQIFDMSINGLVEPSAEQIDVMQAAQEGKDNPMAWRYIPAVGGFGAAISEPTIFPSENIITEIYVGSGKIDWNHLTWEQNPTQFHIVNALADLPILEYRPAVVTKGSTNLLLPERWPRALPVAKTIKEIKKVGFVGGGTMGCANSLVAAVAGYEAVIYDISSERLELVRPTQAEMGKYLVSTGFCTAEELAASAARIACESDLAKALEDVDLVSESVIEELGVKREVHAELDRLCPAHTILTTNTSAMLVSDIEDAVERGDRFAALHSHLGAPLIDIVGGPRTSPATIDILTRYVRSINSVPLVLKKENRGYVLNALLGPVLTMALVLLIEGVANKEQVDRAWMKYRRAPMGPFGMMDLFGLNVVHDGWQHRPAEKVSMEVQLKIEALLRSYVEKGDLGSKTGKGFYSYPNPAFEQAGFLEDETNVPVANLAMTTTLVGNALVLAANGIAEPEEIDRAWKVGMKLGSGPFELLDEIGANAFLQTLRSQPDWFSTEDAALIEQYLAGRELANDANT